MFGKVFGFLIYCCFLDFKSFVHVRCFLADESGLTSNLAFLQAMNGQYLCNRQITTSYAYKKDTKGERHEIPADLLTCGMTRGMLLFSISCASKSF
ncbi:hypothetical protein P3L10_013560 [Capsicum annuum]